MNGFVAKSNAKKHGMVQSFWAMDSSWCTIRFKSPWWNGLGNGMNDLVIHYSYSWCRKVSLVG